MLALHQICAFITLNNDINTAIRMITTLFFNLKTMATEQFCNQGFKILPRQLLKPLTALALHAPEHTVASPALPHAQHTKSQNQHRPSKLQPKRYPSGHNTQTTSEEMLLSRC